MSLGSRKSYRGKIISFSFLIAIILTAMPLPEWAISWKPLWVVMVLVYWCMALPEKTSIVGIFFIGLLLDVYQGIVFGSNALALLVVAYMTNSMYARMRMFPWIQQSMVVFFILFSYLLIEWIINVILGSPPVGSLNYWLPAISSILLWPWVFVLLRGLRRDFY